MDFDLFFSTPRWRILEILAKKPSSPVEISQKIKTSVAYVSQQLKLLEAANLVTKTRTGSVEKGKPRTVYSISREIAQFSVLMNKLPSRKLVHLTDHHKIILRIWMVENSDLHYFIEKFYWKIEDDLQNIEGIFVNESLIKPRVIIVADSKKLKPRVESFLKDHGDKIDCTLSTTAEFKKLPQKDLHVIHDPKCLILEENQKGGNK